MFDFNSISIKTTPDLQRALQVEHSNDQFVYQVESMIERWGIKDTLRMLGSALCGNETIPAEPGQVPGILQFKERCVIDNPHDPCDDGHLVPIPPTV